MEKETRGAQISKTTEVDLRKGKQCSEEDLKIRCDRQRKQLAGMARQIVQLRHENKRLRYAWQGAIARFDELKVDNDEFRLWVAKSRAKIEKLLDESLEGTKENDTPKVLGNKNK